MARRIKIVAPDRAELAFDTKNIELIEGKKKVDLGSLKSREKKEARWKVRAIGKEGAELEISVLSTRGGVEKRKIRVG
jgi:hypothetical protein